MFLYSHIDWNEIKHICKVYAAALNAALDEPQTTEDRTLNGDRFWGNVYSLAGEIETLTGLSVEKLVLDDKMMVEKVKFANGWVTLHNTTS